MKLENGVMLITYANSLGRNISELRDVLGRYFDGAIAGVHLLPFYPSSSDRGFAPLRYDVVDPEFGDWGDVSRLAERYSLIVDFMINHLSSHSPQFRDFVENKDKSAFREMFIRYKDFWPNGAPTAEELDRIYKRKPRAPYVVVRFKDGSEEKVWCTFGDDQIDLNLQSEVTWQFIRNNLAMLASRGAAVIRLDAFAYAIKKVGGSCFFEEPEIWDILARVKEHSGATPG